MTSNARPVTSLPFALEGRLAAYALAAGAAFPRDSDAGTSDLHAGDDQDF